jgi:hypothetical protein
MSPTMPIPSAPPPQRPADTPSADNDGGDAFAHLLQRAQTSSHTASSTSQRAVPTRGDGRAQEARAGHGQRPARDAAPRGDDPDSDQTCVDAATSGTTPTTDTNRTGDGALRGDAPCADITAQQAAPLPTLDPKPATASAIAPPLPSADVDAGDESAAVIDQRAITPRAGARTGHDARTVSGAPNRPALAIEPVLQREPASAGALPLRAALDRVAGEGNATPRRPATHRPSSVRSSRSRPRWRCWRRRANPSKRARRGTTPSWRTPRCARESKNPSSAIRWGIKWHCGERRRAGGQATTAPGRARTGHGADCARRPGRARRIHGGGGADACIDRTLAARAGRCAARIGLHAGGGGVSSQSAGGGDARREPGARGTGNRSRIVSDAEARTALPARRWTRSLLDVYA